MGFFSSRHTDGDFVVHEQSTRTTAVVQVIRSRFYGKSKRSESRTGTGSSGTFVPHDVSAASTLSHPVQPTLRKSQSTPFTTAVKKVGPSRLRNKIDTSSSNNLRAPEQQKSIILGPGDQHTTGTRPGISSSKLVHGTSTVSTASASSTSPPHGTTTPSNITARSSTRTDTVTMTLAQRLNELAVANEEGLLNDDDYRLLRQNLFERFAGNATVPTEKSIVPESIAPLGVVPGSGMAVSEGRASISSSRLSSNFHVDVAPSSGLSTRSPSIRSVRSGVASILQRAKNRGSNRDRSDTSSIYSVNSTTSSAFPAQSRATATRVGSVRSVKRKTSDTSIGTDGPKNPQSDTFSLSSRTSRNTGLGYSDRSPSDGYSPQTPSRSASSIRRLAVPPSSFSTKGLNMHSDHKHTGGGERLQDLFDDSNLVTSADIKREMAAIEAEGKRLMDAFNGLEVTTLAKRQKSHYSRQDNRPMTIVGDIQPVSASGAAWTLTPDSKMHFRPNLHVDTDVVSIRSGTSVHTARSTRSMHREGTSASSTRMPLPPLPTKSSLASISASGGSLHRKNSSSSMGSSVAASKRRGLTPSSPAVPVPALPSNLGHLGRNASGSNSSLNLTRSTGHLPMLSVPEDEVQVGDNEVDEEMEELRRRRDEVSRRYEERIEYLRAKLKGAQLHEKLMKK
ncbi:hypothetical protein GYMLUDRAFT_76938 [Collybiopsis luxurians FD-317 M1]|uniref:Uncharacterized protein n=1 Tax=Collybiopsis luxurians FD-317 M1 TaxID=944289 RepID=A0A0D0BXQ4_9AGAR|nr:hypothetical protein GYMLUDRAFT_76938 [Collybiopsis luxurians FD-317 M1]